MTNDNIIDAIINNISKVDIIDEPFDHMFIQNIFPEDFYCELLDNIPKKKNYTAINKTKQLLLIIVKKGLYLILLMKKI